MVKVRQQKGLLAVLIGLAALMALPFLLRRGAGEPPTGPAEDRLVIITPHVGVIRDEFGEAFRQWYGQKTGRSVEVDWRVIGGTSEIGRFLEAEYIAAFENWWTRPGRRWSAEVLTAFQNPRVELDATPEDDTVAEAARRAFLQSEISSGIDLFFGGGTYDFVRQAAAGRLVPSEIFTRQPGWFAEEIIPQRQAGELYWDSQQRWVGTVVSSYGILFNRDAVERRGMADGPRTWQELGDPRLYGSVALADPTKSGSSAKAFEMVIQQAMGERREGESEAAAVRRGWKEGLQLLQRIAGNARYFSDASSKPPIDVAQGDAAAGMCIDFYGRLQQEAVRNRGGGDRLEFVAPPGGTVYSVDPIGLLRGAPNRPIAEAFIEFVLSPEGQRLWNFKVGTPGGPARYALRRLPVRRDFYRPETESFRSDAGVSPYGETAPLVYREAWTGHLFRELSFIIRVAFLDAHAELREAWRTLAEAGMPAEALVVLQDLSVVSYQQAEGPIKQTLTARDRVRELELAEQLGRHFREQYRRAAELARRTQAGRTSEPRAVSWSNDFRKPARSSAR